MACQLTFLERERVSQMHDAGASNAEIAAELSRARSTIGREIKRNSVVGEYSAVAAQALAQKRRRERPWVRKMDEPEISRYVRSRLVDSRSPDQIAGRSKSDFGDDRRRHISHQTIVSVKESPACSQGQRIPGRRALAPPNHVR
jgi:transposase, IS30 family